MNTFIHSRQGMRITASVAIATILFPLLSDSALAASSWNPTMLVNTESFNTIDEGDSTTNIEIRFGQSLNEKLFYDRTTSRFTFTKGIYVNGSITGSGLVIRGQMSG
ncbi:hypothetical protein HZA45_03335, partial [Candidatus Peregrinibacteria bacterium]|nr:hypothetical protein [Candidatus Peregrinibacteria bacterium]